VRYTLLESVGLKVSAVGLGTVKFGRNEGVKYPQQFSLPTDKDILTLLDCAEELGINLLDTAPAYGVSEERLGKLLKDKRDRWVLCTKVGEEFVNGESYFDFSPHAIRQSINRSLRRLNTDVLDIVLVHSNGDDKKIIEEDSVFETLAQLKKAGLIRAFVMSTKTLEGGLLAVDHSDVVMVAYNPLHTEECAVIKHAYQNKKGVFIKKALESGHLQKLEGEDPVRTAMQFIFSELGVSSVIFGTLSEVHLRHNVGCVEGVL
jgi:aryl-alcohol dehydrogenase-like predicted oxidoreductase